MTDKQIIGGRGSAKSFTTLNTVEVLLENEKLKEALKAKEQECEELKDKLNCCFCNPYVELNNIEKQRKCIEVTECFRQQLDQLKAENEELKQTLTEIKPILELYANSKVGEEQPDGTYKLSSAIWDSFGFCTTTYDPRPARKALQKISECEVENADK